MSGSCRGGKELDWADGSEASRTVVKCEGDVRALHADLGLDLERVSFVRMYCERNAGENEGSIRRVGWTP